MQLMMEFKMNQGNFDQHRFKLNLYILIGGN